MIAEREGINGKTQAMIGVTKAVRDEFNRRKGSQPAVDYLIHLMDLEDNAGRQPEIPETPRVKRTTSAVKDAVSKVVGFLTSDDRGSVSTVTLLWWLDMAIEAQKRIQEMINERKSQGRLSIE